MTCRGKSKTRSFSSLMEHSRRSHFNNEVRVRVRGKKGLWEDFLQPEQTNG